MEIFLIAVVAIVVVAAIWAISSYNGFIRLKNLVAESWKQVDVELQRRYDLIPNLVNIVKGAAGFEQSTLEKVIEARQQAMSLQSGTPAERQDAEIGLGGALKSLFALAEAYPALTATANYRELQVEVSNTEDRIAASRRFYNQNVRDWNTKRETVPATIIAGMFHFEPADYFELDTEEARRPVNIEFGPDGI